MLEFLVRNRATAWISLFEHGFERLRVSLDFADERYNFMTALLGQIVRYFFICSWPVGGSLVHHSMQRDPPWVLTLHIYLVVVRSCDDVSVEVF